jgi:beta-lactamase class D
VTARSRRIVREAMPALRGGNGLVRAKSGTALAAKGGIAWWVGWVERDGEPEACFALNYRTGEPASRTARLEIGLGILEEAGVLPKAGAARTGGAGCAS